MIERPSLQSALAESFCTTGREAKQLVKQFGGTRKALPRGWQRKFLDHSRHKPLKIGQRLLIVSERGDVAHHNHRHVLAIPAAAAFGTGEHATTAMCLRMLERISRSRALSWSLLDLGTGSGILALAARRFGARRVVAIDNDSVAISTARQNTRLNRIEGVKFVAGDASKLKALGAFDVITANLYSELLIHLMPQLAWHLNAEGYLVLSGILREQEAAVQHALRRSDFRSVEARRRGKWIALLAARSGGKRQLNDGKP